MSQIRLEAMRLASGYDTKSVEKTIEMAEQIAVYIQYGPGGKPKPPVETSEIPPKKRRKLKLNYDV